MTGRIKDIEAFFTELGEVRMTIFRLKQKEADLMLKLDQLMKEEERK